MATTKWNNGYFLFSLTCLFCTTISVSSINVPLTSVNNCNKCTILEEELKIIQTKLDETDEKNIFETQKLINDVFLHLNEADQKMDNTLTRHSEESDKNIKSLTSECLRESKNTLAIYNEEYDKRYDSLNEKFNKLEKNYNSLNEKNIEDMNKIENLDEQYDEIKDKLANLTTLFMETRSNIPQIYSHLDLIPGSKPQNCYDILQKGDAASGVRTIFPDKHNIYFNITVFCDHLSAGGGWTVIQKRVDLPVRENFDRTWMEYEEGFGNRTGEYWLGLKAMHTLTSSKSMELMITLESAEGETRYARYTTFSVADGSDKYKLTIGGFSGNAGDSLTEWHNGMKFSTKENENDVRYNFNCAEDRKSGWWFNSCETANLNGPPSVGYVGTPNSIHWDAFKGGEYSNRKVAMMVRPINSFTLYFSPK